MKNPTNSGYDDLDELLRQVDELVNDPVPGPADDTAPGEDFFESVEEAAEEEFDPDDYAPGDCGDDPVLYQNYSNHYGADIRNFSNGYGSGSAAPVPPQPEPAPVIPAYNADFQRVSRQEADYADSLREPRDLPRRRTKSQAVAERETRRPRKKSRRRRRGPGCGCMTVIVLLLVLVIGGGMLWHSLFRMPVSPVSIGERKKDSASVLVCGLGWEQSLTDTMMLVHVDGTNHQVNLLSLPRDTRTVTGQGGAGKLNAAYVRNGTGRDGMEGLLDYVQNLIGYRPDGYVLVNLSIVSQAADLMGSLEVEVPMAFDLEGVHVDAGLQTLNGSQVLQLLRFREGYAMADLQRVEVQRSVISAALDQWLSLENLTKIPRVLSLIRNGSEAAETYPGGYADPFTAPPFLLTDLDRANFLWLAKTALGCMMNGEPGQEKIVTSTLPGAAAWIDGQSFYEPDLGAVAELINASYNPYLVPIRAENLSLTGDVSNG